MAKAGKRGGSRPGAGRRRVLTARERQWVALRCQELQKRIGRKVALERAKTVPAQVREAQDEARQIVAFIARTGLDQLREKHLGPASSKIDEIFGKRGRYQHVPVRRPKGVRQLILEKIARIWNAEHAANLKKQITPRRVEACWKEYRRVRKLAADSL